MKQISPNTSPAAAHDVPRNTAPSSNTSAAGAPAGFDVPCNNRFEISLKLPSFRSGNAPTKKRLHLMWEAHGSETLNLWGEPHGCRVYVAHLVGLSVPPLKVEA